MIRFLFLLVFSILLTSCATQPSKESNDLSEEGLTTLLTDAVAMIKQGNVKRAIDGPLATANASCDRKFVNTDKRYFVARDPAETLLLLTMAIATDDKKDAVVIDTVCPDVFFMTGYAYVDLGKIDESMVYINKAIAMSPFNSQYLSELGHLYQTQRKFDQALKAFQQSEDAAEKWSPEPIKKDELARAKRGVGYNLIELHRLDEAEAKFKECLELNPADKGALNELAYIDSLRKQKTAE